MHDLDSSALYKEGRLWDGCVINGGRGGGIPHASLRSLLRLNRKRKKPGLKRETDGEGYDEEQDDSGGGGLKKGDGLDGKSDIQAGEDKERKREQAVQIHAGLRNH